MPRRAGAVRGPPSAPSAGDSSGSAPGDLLPIAAAPSQFAELERPVVAEEEVAPKAVARGVVVFDLDGTILDDIGLISVVAADVMLQAFGTPAEEGRLHYLATTGMPFEAQLAQLYPDVPAPVRAQTARVFHQRKVQEAYAHAKPFPEVPRLLRRLSQAGWTLVISTGAEREMADLMLEREGLRYWFEAVLGSGQGTKREHLVEYRRRFPRVPIFLVGDSRFDMEAGTSAQGVRAIGRASRLHDWTLSPLDLEKWGAVWSDYSLAELPEVLERLSKGGPTRARRSPRSPVQEAKKR